MYVCDESPVTLTRSLSNPTFPIRATRIYCDTILPVNPGIALLIRMSLLPSRCPVVILRYFFFFLLVRQGFLGIEYKYRVPYMLCQLPLTYSIKEPLLLTGIKMNENYSVSAESYRYFFLVLVNGCPRFGARGWGRLALISNACLMCRNVSWKNCVR